MTEISRIMSNYSRNQNPNYITLLRRNSTNDLGNN